MRLLTPTVRHTTLVAALLGVFSCTDVVPPANRTAVVVPPAGPILVGRSVTVSGSVQGTPVWSVNGIAGGNSTVGTISSAGLYSAPTLVPHGNPVSIRIAAADNAADSASVQLAVVPSTPAGEWVAWQPRVIDAARTDSVSLVVSAAPGMTRVEFVAATSPTPVEFRHVSGSVYQVELAAATVLQAYAGGDLHAFAGFIDFYDAGGTRRRINGFASVRDATVPAVTVTSLAADAQSATHVLNLRVDSVPATGVDERAIAQRAYALLPDAYDFLAIVQPVTYVQNRYYIGVRNATSGLGIGMIDQGAQFGSASRLQGVVHYPVDGYFDLGEQAANHEIGHRWINFLGGTPLSPGSPHWPYSSLASGVMGISIAGSGAGGTFNRTFVANGDGTWRVVPATDTGSFNDLELYLMGLLPADSVGTHIVFDNQSQFVSNVANVTGPVTTVTVNDIVAAKGARLPAYGSAQSTFHAGTVVVSVGRLLSPDELAFFDHMAARGEATTRLPYTSGFLRGMSKPFYVATGGRGRLVTALH